MGTRAPGQDAGGRERGAREHAVSRQARPGAGATGPAPRTPPFLRQIRVNRVQLPRELRGHAPCSFERASRPGSPHRPYASQSAVAASRPLRHRAAHPPPLRISPRVRARIRAQNCRRPAVAPRRDRRHHRAPAAACRAADVARTPRPRRARRPSSPACCSISSRPPHSFPRGVPHETCSFSFLFSFLLAPKIRYTRRVCVLCLRGGGERGPEVPKTRRSNACAGGGSLATGHNAAARARLPARWALGKTQRRARSAPVTGNTGRKTGEARTQHGRRGQDGARLWLLQLWSVPPPPAAACCRRNPPQPGCPTPRVLR